MQKNNPIPSPWRAILPVGVALALSLAGDLTLYTILPAYHQVLSIDLYAVGVLLSANRFVRFLTNPLFGWLMDRWGRRQLLLTGLATGAFSTLIYALAPGFWVFLLGRLIWGCSWSLIYIGTYSMVLDAVGEIKRGWGSGVLQMFYYAGLFINPLAGGLLSDNFGFSSTLIICSSISVLGLLQAVLFLPQSPPPALDSKVHRSLPDITNSVLEATRRLRREARAWIKSHPDVIGSNLIYMLSLFIVDGVLLSTITLYLIQNYGEKLSIGNLVLTAAAAGGVMLAVRAVFSAAVAPLAGKISDLRGGRWPVVGWGLALGIAGCILMSIGGMIGLSTLGVILVSLSNGIVLAILPVIATRSSREGRNGMSLGILATSGDLGLAIAPLAAYSLAGTVSLNVLYLGAAGLLVFGLAVTLIFSLSKQGQTIYKPLI